MIALAGIILYVLIIAVIAGIVFAVTARYRRVRMERGRVRVPHGFVRTDEILIDPTTGVRQRIWYNERTGERWYETLTDANDKTTE